MHWLKAAGMTGAATGGIERTCLNSTLQEMVNPMDNRVRIMDVPIDNLSLQETIERVQTLIESGKPHQHVVINVDKLIKMRRDPRLRAIIEDCDLINVDGQPIVWASRILGQPLKERITGTDLMEELVRVAAERHYRAYFLGARPEVVREVVMHYENKYPDLCVAGWRDGYWQEEEEPGIVETVRQAKPHILFVGFSSPRKEYFIGRHLEAIGVPFSMGVGGSFDVIAGVIRRAPLRMRKRGLEWLWRLTQEPRRMWRRYLVDDMVFPFLVFRELLRKWGLVRNRQDRSAQRIRTSRSAPTAGPGKNE